MPDLTRAASGGTVLVLGGGGARGAAQLGILRALARRGIQPDACVGTSVGALNAAVCARHPLDEAVGLLEMIWASPQTRDVFRSRRLAVVANQLRRRPYLRSGEPIRELVRSAASLADLGSFEDLPRPLRIVMTDLCAGEAVVASSGALDVALRASTAIPGVYPPVAIDGRLCVDGGVTENCSLATAAALDPGRIIAIDLSAATPIAALRRWSEVIDRMCQVALDARLTADFDRFSARLPVTLIRPKLFERLEKPHFRDFVAMRDAAFAAAERLLQRISDAEGHLEAGVFDLPLRESQRAAV